jgi:hypothetical protein
MTPNIGDLREQSRILRDEAYRAADQLSEDCGHSSVGSDGRAAAYYFADRDFHDRNAAVDRLANAPQHPTGNPDSNEALRFLASMEVDQPPTEPAPRNRMENGPRGTFTGTTAEFLELKRLGTLTPEEAEPEPIFLPEPPSPRVSRPGDMEVEGSRPSGSPSDSLFSSGDRMTPAEQQAPSAPPRGLVQDIEKALARTKA